VKECIHRIAMKDVKLCDNTAAGKNTVICEFPGWEGKECPFDMREKDLITEAEFYQLWLEAIKLDVQNSDPKK